MITREDTVRAYREYIAVLQENTQKASDLAVKEKRMAKTATITIFPSAVASAGGLLLGLIGEQEAVEIAIVVGGMIGMICSFPFMDTHLTNTRKRNEEVEEARNGFLDVVADEARHMGLNVLEVHYKTQHIVATEGIITVALDEGSDIPELLLNGQVIQQAYRSKDRTMKALDGSTVMAPLQPLLLP